MRLFSKPHAGATEPAMRVFVLNLVQWYLDYLDHREEQSDKQERRLRARQEQIYPRWK